MLEQKNDNYFMQAALKEAVNAYENDEVPVGAVIVHKNKIIAKAHNQVELLHDPTAHAEMIAITQACEALSSWRLNECKIYVTLEPCPMCAGALQLARIDEIVYATDDPKKGACGSLLDIVSDSRFNHTIKITKGIMAEDAGFLLKVFFKKIRKTKSQLHQE